MVVFFLLPLLLCFAVLVRGGVRVVRRPTSQPGAVVVFCWLWFQVIVYDYDCFVVSQHHQHH